ncbi:MAG TPA: hypothetical protein VEX35_14105 [Allosphingosinicella sp.]|nr:hypothetical protein [Allosphingosinicella sp.]
MRAILSLLLPLLLLAAAAPAQAQSDPGNPEAAFADLRAMVDQMRTRYYTRGELVAGWDQGGADPERDLRAAGAETHYFSIVDRTGRSVGILTRRPLADFAPAGWRVVDTYGSSATRLDNPSIAFEMLSHRYAVGLRANGRRQRDADCTDPIANATLYEIPGAPAREGDEMIPVLFRVVLLSAEGQVVCSRAEGSARTGYRSRAFTPDGYRLPAFDENEEVIRIVPAAPIDRLVAFVPVTQG